ncbi:MAG: hypothetical protein D6755_11910 [Anaerolineae bacterium]|nr:MAG: hypothetical protein D6755_11910 [Anaerolineae bacterium]
MKRNLVFPLIGVCALVLTSLACQTLLGGGSNLPQAGSAPADTILFQDDFSDSNSGWDAVRVDEGITDYENGAYRIFVNMQNNDVWANPGLSFTDVHIAVDATKIGGPDDNDFGVICRYEDADNFYFFIISSDGFYGIGKVSGGEQSLLGMDGMGQSDAIFQGAATNHIEAECKGSQLTLWANGTQLFSTEDSEFSSGDVGLIAGTFDTVGTDISFDNFIVTRP